MNRLLSILLAILLGLTASSALAGGAEGFAIPYPSYMVEAEGERLVLEARPERIVCLSNAALQALVRSDVRPIAVTTPTAYVGYPDWVMELPIIATGMNTLDTEAVIALEPDLVIMGIHLKEAFGQQLADADIPVYYTSEGPSIAYAETKEEALTLAGAFGTEELVDALAGEFEAVETRAAEYTAANEARSMMILFAAPPSYQQTSKGYLGSILSMLPFENLSDTIIDPEARTAPLDLEMLVAMNPEVLFAISPTSPTAEVLRQADDEEFEKNPNIWKQLDAVNEDRIVYLSSEYVTSKGMHIIRSIHALIDLIEEKL